jgi:Domain of unknown function (DUF4180)
MTCKVVSGARVADTEGIAIEKEQDALALISKALERRTDWLVVSFKDIAPDFFRLKTGFAGEVCQKFVNYGVRLAIVGDVSAHIARSKSLADFVRESNRGRQIWFVKDMDELKDRLAKRP